VVLVGDDPASESYVARKHADCEETAIVSQTVRLPADVPQDELLRTVARLNSDVSVQGFIVQLPLPRGLDAAAAITAMDPAKDIDGLHPVSLGRMLAGDPGLRPCTPQGIIALLRAYDIPLAGRRVTIIGRGPLVGRPLSVMLGQPEVDAVVTVAHSATPDLAASTRDADVVVSAAGVPDLVTAAMIKPGAAVVGVGITYVGGAMVSDIAEDVAGVAAYVTPRHGSVGPLTRAMLLHNLLLAAAG